MNATSNKGKLLNVGVWLLTIVVTVLAVMAWGQTFSWQFSTLNTYQIFPLLGLVAFSLMWTHYVASVARQEMGLERGVIKQWFVSTSWVVLILICLHPGLLIWQLYRDGFGLPPTSYEKVYGGATIFGTVSLLAFLAFELHRWFARRSWWKYVGYVTDVAMVAIVYHSLKLGTQLQKGWYKGIWWFYAVTLLGALVYKYVKKFTAKPAA